MNKELLQERKKMIYDFICDELYVPMKAKEMAIVLNVPKSQRGELLEVLDALTADGKVEISGRGKYVKSEGKYLTGVFTAHPRGFGFVTVEGEEEDIFIPAAQTNGALHKDTVQITLSKNSSGKRKEGTVTKILSRGTEQLVCTYEKSKTFGFAVPDNPRFAQDIFIPLERSKGAVSGHKVVVEITDYGKNGKKPEGKVVEIIGHINDPGTDIMSIVKGYDLPVEFSQKIMKQVENVSNEVSAADMAGAWICETGRRSQSMGRTQKTLMMRSRSQKREIFMNLESTLPMYPTMCRRAAHSTWRHSKEERPCTLSTA